MAEFDVDEFLRGPAPPREDEKPFDVNEFLSSPAPDKKMTWQDVFPVRVAKDIYKSVVSGATLPGDVYAGRAKLPSSEGIPGSVPYDDPQSSEERVTDLAMFGTPGVATRHGVGWAGVRKTPPAKAVVAAKAEAEAAANQAAAREFDIQLSRGQATGDPSAIRFEDLAAREAHGKPAQDIAAPFFENQFQAVQDANRTIGEGLARGRSVAENPSEAAATINAELGARGKGARALVQAAEAAAEREAAAARSMVDDQGRALSDVVAGGHPPIENPREAGEVVGQAVRSAAERARANYQGLYDEALGLPGQFDAGAFEGIGTRIQGRLTFGDNPVIIDDITTPIASRAVRDLENISGLRFQNRAHPLSEPPFGAPNPENTLAPVVPIDLRGVDQARKRLVAYYRSARGSPNAADARAVGRLIDEFDNEIEQSIANGLFSGDPRALDALQQARAAYSRYAKQFRPQQAGDDVGTAMRRIIDRNATPEEIANMVVGSGRIGDRGLPVRIADRLEEVLGRDTEAWSSIRQAIWQRASQVRTEAGGVNTRGIDDLVSSSLGRRMFNDVERDAMRAHSAAVRDLDNVIENLGATRAAEIGQAVYQRIFSGESIGGAQGAVFRRIIDGTATAEETAQAVFGVISGNPGNARRVIGAIEGIVGRDSETMAAIRQGVWQRLTQNAATKDQPGYQKVSQALGEFLEGKGRSVATSLYTPEEIALMQRYQGVLKQLVIPKNARTNSDTAPALMAIANKYGNLIMGSIGAFIETQMGGMGLTGAAAGIGVKELISRGASTARDVRAARRVSRSLYDPINAYPSKSAPGALPQVQTLSGGLAAQGTARDLTRHRDDRPRYARGGRTAKPSKAQTHYRLGSGNKRCDICTMFRAPHTCTAIVGKVSKIGLCDLFERKQAYAEGGEVADSDDNADPFERAAARARARYLGRNVVGMQRGPAEGDVAPDALRSIPRGVVLGLGELASHAGLVGAAEADPSGRMMAQIPSSEEGRDLIEQHVTGPLHQPESFAGKAGAEFGRIAANPMNWVGPGGAGYKTGFNALSALGAEAGDAAAPEGYEQVGRTLGGFTPMAAERALPAVGRLAPQGSLGSLGGKMVIPEREGIRAYHSSPHDFDRFDSSKIGTGEGAQTYGHGIYFAENPAVSGQGGEYWNAFRSRFKGPEGLATYELGKAGFDRNAAAQNMSRQIAAMKADIEAGQFSNGQKMSPAYITDQIYELNQRRQGLKLLEGDTLVGPRTYEVNINARPEQLLDWDKPLIDQPVADTVRGLVPKDLRKTFDYNVERGGVTGANVYNNYVPNQSFVVRDSLTAPYRPTGAKTFEDALALTGGNPAMVRTINNPSREIGSQRLRDAGIPGIRYLDQGSRVSADHIKELLKLYGTRDRMRHNVAEWATNAGPDDEYWAKILQQMDKPPTSNYVMFPGTEGLIDIRKKYVLPIATAGGMGGLAAQDKPEPGLARGGRTNSTQFQARMRAAMGGRAMSFASD